jgi:hypothetical protein
MFWRQSVMALGLLVALAGCQRTDMADEQEATADDLGDDQNAEDLGGGLPDVGDFRDPRFGRKGLRR